jgi:hypothetical protein
MSVTTDNKMKLLRQKAFELAEEDVDGYEDLARDLVIEYRDLVYNLIFYILEETYSKSSLEKAACMALGKMLEGEE